MNFHRERDFLSVPNTTVFPLVSVVVPVFNTARFVADCIRSILGQSYPRIEVIVVDDGSDDHSATVIRELARSDQRVQLIQLSSNQGPAIARNHGLRVATARFIAFCDSDDLWQPDKLVKQMAAMQETGAAICCCGYVRIAQDGHVSNKVVRPPPRIEYSRLLRSCQIGMSTALVDRDRLGAFEFPNLPMRQDYALWLRLLEARHLCIGLREVLVCYRHHRQSLSSNKLMASWYHWRVLRSIAGLSVVKAIPLFLCYIYISFLNRLVAETEP